ncbi:presenilins-associated rhomboid-like protein mitochondrial [Biomphalaria glabrata]|uniref:rhomboid protease n=1 Tax=Biomphalaria glabrata TaxID=6526 RepID=A0A9U8EFQ6_BIOGL|nr:presenilins-associated rhomboid-like protein, mitochondrial [Biomphalaria glabrata]KAI8750953.1 presenilins-associated rhomboid-like protein; mitochondrial [Biomphalaria glabrata]
MALPYSCCRLLTFHQSLNSLRFAKNSLYHPLQQNVRHSGFLSVSSVFRLQFDSQGHKLFYRLCRRGFKTKQMSQEAEIHGNEPSLFKHFLFTIGVCGCSFSGAMIWNYEKMRKVFQDLQNGTKKDSIFEKKQKKAFGFRDHANSFWEKLSGGQKMVVGIIAANLGVFLMWRVAALQPMMLRYFTTSITHPLPSMLLSSFSHVSFWHLFVNMYVLWSFASVTVNMFGFEQFAAFYVSAGTISSFTSMACSKLLRRPYIVSVGASGAIMALLGAVCSSFPNAQLGIAFISEIFPHSFSADSGMKAIIAFDLLGLILGWRFLDHAGHLGGIFFGILYAKYGNQYVWGKRETIMKWWHNLRGKP